MKALSHRDELEQVLRIACLTEDRDPAEQRAMLGLALRLDQEFASFSAYNPDRRCPQLTDLVEETYEPSDGRRVNLTGSQRGRLERLTAKWVACGSCGQPMGAHYESDRCPGEAP